MIDQFDPRLEEALEILSIANKLYTDRAKEVPQFKDFAEKRHLSLESIDNFQIGFALDYSILLKHLTMNQRETLLEIGLLRKDVSTGKTYAYYRNRIMFPILDYDGKVRGFSSRAVSDDQYPRYLNSMDSFAFSNGQILYGYFLAKKAIEKSQKVIIVEGNMDVIMMHQHGFKETVGTMGRALSDESLDRIIYHTRHTKNIYLAMDSDKAGKVATKRINEQFIQKGVFPKFIDLTPARDPDEFLQTEGAVKLHTLIESAPRILDSKIIE